MKRFVKGYMTRSVVKTAEDINALAEKNNLNIISISSSLDAESGCSHIIVLFEKMDEEGELSELQ